MSSRFTHNATTAAYLLLAGIAGGLVLDHPVRGAVGVSAVTWPVALGLKRHLTRDERRDR